jgi:hypothetical protein
MDVCPYRAWCLCVLGRGSARGRPAHWCAARTGRTSTGSSGSTRAPRRARRPAPGATRTAAADAAMQGHGRYMAVRPRHKGRQPGCHPDLCGEQCQQWEGLRRGVGGGCGGGGGEARLPRGLHRLLALLQHQHGALACNNSQVVRPQTDQDDWAFLGLCRLPPVRLSDLRVRVRARPCVRAAPPPVPPPPPRPGHPWGARRRSDPQCQTHRATRTTTTTTTSCTPQPPQLTSAARARHAQNDRLACKRACLSMDVCVLT